MAELFLHEEDRRRLAEILKPHKAVPPGVRQGTWRRLKRYRDLECLELDELRALVRVEPRIIFVLGLPIQAFPKH
ncbi:MAG: hypothetical protein IIA89_12950 [Chloroflexi bacterium]|nr:hypothetical protein [Chloroflexota bacterium]